MGIGLAVLRHAPTNRKSVVVVSPLRTRLHHHLVRISAKTPLNGLENLGVDFSELVKDGKAHLQGQQSAHVAGVVQPAEQHFTLDVIKFQHEHIVGLSVSACYTIREPRQKVGD